MRSPVAIMARHYNISKLVNGGRAARFLGDTHKYPRQFISNCRMKQAHEAPVRFSIGI